MATKMANWADDDSDEEGGPVVAAGGASKWEAESDEEEETAQNEAALKSALQSRQVSRRRLDEIVQLRGSDNQPHAASLPTSLSFVLSASATSIPREDHHDGGIYGHIDNTDGNIECALEIATGVFSKNSHWLQASLPELYDDMTVSHRCSSNP